MSKKKIKTKSGGPVKEVGILATRRGNLPDQEEINWLLALANEGRINEAAIVADAMTSRFPRFGFGWKVQGVLLYQTGQIADAVPALQKAAALMPGDPEAHFNLGNVMKDLGKLDDAVIGYRKALAINPRYAEAHSNLGATLQALGHHEDAVASLRRAVGLMPDSASVQFNLANALIDAEQTAEAVTAYRRTLELAPELLEAQLNLAMAQESIGNSDDAIESYRDALRIGGQDAEVHRRIGHLQKAAGRLDAAEAAYRSAILVMPRNVEALNDLGSILIESERAEEATNCIRRSLLIRPDFALGHSNLGAALHACGRNAEATESYRHAIELDPGSPDAYCNLGVLLEEMGDPEEALANYRSALAVRPGFEAARLNETLTLQKVGRFDEASSCLQQAIARNPNFADGYLQLGGVLQQLGRVDEAIECLRSALAKWPDFAAANSAVQYFLNYHGRSSAQELLASAKEWQSMTISPSVATVARERQFQRASREGRRLRVGYMSGDFRLHAVSFFFEPIIKSHDSSRIETFGYFTARKRDEDAVTARIKGTFDHWRSLADVSDEVACARILHDEIDVLIDLSGHTAYGRPGVIARRPAPIQTHYLGYFGTTGLTEMDYWIGDPVLFPAGKDAHFSERIWRLPRVWVSYRGDDEIPHSQWQPSSNDAVRFGSFNNLAKLTPATMAVWAKLLQAAPKATLTLKTPALADASNRKRVVDQMVSLGVDPSRLELLGPKDDHLAHFAAYDRVDVALDPIGGMGGGTTTCDALWMGAPVVTLAGNSMKERMTASMLDAIGRPEWIAATEAEYIDKAVTLARDVEMRRQLRSSLRERMRNSPLCDAAGLARSLEYAYEAMYDAWRHKQPSAVV